MSFSRSVWSVNDGIDLFRPRAPIGLVTRLDVAMGHSSHISDAAFGASEERDRLCRNSRGLFEGSCRYDFLRAARCGDDHDADENQQGA